MLVCRVRALRVAVPLQNVIETMRPLPVEPFAGSPNFVLGLAVIRGVPTPVVNLGTLLGRTEPAVPTRLVTLRVGEQRVALEVESVEGIWEPSLQGVHSLPPLIQDAGGGAVAAVRALDAELMVVLAAAKIIPEEVWDSLKKVRESA